jgi:hypothetical protein
MSTIGNSVGLATAFVAGIAIAYPARFWPTAGPRAWGSPPGQCGASAKQRGTAARYRFRIQNYLAALFKERCRPPCQLFWDGKNRALPGTRRPWREYHSGSLQTRGKPAARRLNLGTA